MGKGAFWSCHAGGLKGALFVTLLRRMMRGRRKPLHLIVDGLFRAQDARGAGLRGRILQASECCLYF
ncbi:ISXoo2 transposase [mine drainage metagenome]|uniref:ISXoo2 transposase n=1 Tax=mine drainage metagenome TaxID=410659 RepID=T0ZCB1_9ZZZZ